MLNEVNAKHDEEMQLCKSFFSSQGTLMETCRLAHDMFTTREECSANLETFESEQCSLKKSVMSCAR